MEFSLISQYSNFAILATIFSLSLLFFSNTITWWRNNTKKLTPPPQIKGAWPIIGHLHKVADTTTILHKALGALADEYGPVFTLRLGRERVVVVSSRALAKECYTKNDVALLSRPKLLASQHLGFDYAMLGFTPYGPYWREIRKLTTLHLLSAHRLEQLRPVRASEVSGYVKALMGRTGPGRALVDFKKGFLELTLDIIVRMVVGKRYRSDGPGGPITKEDEEEGKRWQEALEQVFHLFGIIVVGDFLPWLRWMDLGGHEKAMKRVNKECDTILQRLLDEHREKKRTSYGCKNQEDQDFMDVMLSLLEGTNLGGYEADHINKATVFNMIAGGSDTTATTLIWAMSLLLNNRKSLKKAQEELDLQIGKDRQVTELDMSNLPYLQAIVKETLRLYPPSPLSSQHLVIDDCTIGGYHVGRGSRVVVNMSKIHRDPDVWPDPNEFRPERFLTTHKNVDVKGTHYELIPFSAGRRGCPGSSFALHVVHLTLGSLLHAFDFTTPNDDGPIDMTESPGLSNMKVGPLEAFISPRLPHHIYG